MKISSMKCLISISNFLFLFFLSSCGSESLEQQPRFDSSGKSYSSDVSAEDTIPARLLLLNMRTSVSSLDSITDIDFKNSDYAVVLRCSANFQLRSPTGKLMRSASGIIETGHPVEMRAVWEDAIGSIDSCRLLGEKTVRATFSDSLAGDGKYFYLFNPCRESLMAGESTAKPICSYQLVSTEDVDLRNTLNEKSSAVSLQISQKEAQLATLAIRFRQQMTAALNAQRSCENNEAVDAVKEARWKALSSVLATGIAAAVGGAIAGPQSAVSAAQKTLQWIIENFPPGTTHNTTNCKSLLDSETQAKQLAGAIEMIAKEIGQLRVELANL
ncbi:MAG: hypothetical protein ACO3A4_11365 [Silvanigrellaceae bacterium]